MKGKIKSLNISDKKGVCKKPVSSFNLKEDWGVVGDVHAAKGDRQVSFLAWESVQRQKECPKVNKGEAANLQPGDFAENITTEGIDFCKVSLGDKVLIGDTELKISKIGKECHTHCQIYKRLGDCIMPREGVFGEVVVGGEIRVGDKIEIIGQY